MITVAAFVNLILFLVAIGLLLALVHYVIVAIPIPEPFGRLIRIAATVIAVLVVILLVLQLAGGGPFLVVK